MVLGVPGPVGFDTLGSGVDVVEVVPRGAEPATGATDLRAVDGPGARLEMTLLPSPSGLCLPGGPREPGERGAVALCRLLAQRWSVRLGAERLHPAAALVVPEPDGGWGELLRQGRVL
jgi:hypothetical protein